ncbi:uncharacterized protein LOC124626454 isoform X1 [Ictalurus punctatus]|uniref:Uncharacterized protein LOC124626454 isoform X1 n=1 Tax=Ictalurus punctatus TaxID=7998 RepID=A0A979EMY9_ICTPU|nr:uncharacterized protein LOC124626454 isoform X1 [Ictalurus punctatus]
MALWRRCARRAGGRACARRAGGRACARRAGGRACARRAGGRACARRAGGRACARRAGGRACARRAGGRACARRAGGHVSTNQSEHEPERAHARGSRRNDGDFVYNGHVRLFLFLSPPCSVIGRIPRVCLNCYQLSVLKANEYWTALRTDAQYYMDMGNLVFDRSVADDHYRMYMEMLRNARAHLDAISGRQR